MAADQNRDHHTAMPTIDRLAPALRRRLPRPLLTAAAVVAGLFGLTACDQGPSTVTPFMHPSGAFDFLVAATKNEGPLYLEIDGAPFVNGSGLADQVTAVMERALQARILHLTADRKAAEDPRFRLVLVFNPPDSGELLAFCERQPVGGPYQTEGRIDLRAGFCRGDDLIAAVDGWVEEVDGAEDQKFEQFMRQVVRDMFSRSRNDD